MKSLLLTRWMIALSILLAAVSPASAGKRHVARHASARDIDSLYFFGPLTSIGKIWTGNTVVFNDTLSRLGSRMQTDVINHFGERMKIVGRIDIEDTSVRSRIAREIVMHLSRGHRKKYFEDTLMHSVIDSMMDASGKRFALLQMNSGFVRERANYKKQEGQNRRNANLQGLGYVAMAIMDPPPSAVLISATMSVMIFDARENRTYYYNDDWTGVHSGEYNPLNEEDQLAEFKLLFDGFFLAQAQSLKGLGTMQESCKRMKNKLTKIPATMRLPGYFS